MDMKVAILMLLKRHTVLEGIALAPESLHHRCRHPANIGQRLTNSCERDKPLRLSSFYQTAPHLNSTRPTIFALVFPAHHRQHYPCSLVYQVMPNRPFIRTTPDLIFECWIHCQPRCVTLSICIKLREQSYYLRSAMDGLAPHATAPLRVGMLAVTHCSYYWLFSYALAS